MPNCETYEQLYPVRFLQHELRCDAAGPGEFRGGTGAAYRVVVEDEAEYAFRGEGQRTPSGYGVHGGGIGAAGASRSSAPTATRGFRRNSAPAGSGRPRSGSILPRAAAGAIRRSATPSCVLRDVRDGM